MSAEVTSPKLIESLQKVRRFCHVLYDKHGVKAKNGPRKQMYGHDWADLVRDLSTILYGKPADNDNVSCRMVGSLVRDEFPNDQKWNERVNAPGAHEKILEIIRDGLDRLRL